MKQERKTRIELRAVNRCLLFANALMILISCGGGKSAPGVGIQNVTAAAPRLQEVNSSGDYSPYYATGDLQRPRYFHETILDNKGRPIVMGGTDERGYSGLDSLEIFDQSGFEEDIPRPASLTGFWIDTDFAGDPISFKSGPRMLFTTDLLADGRILIVGGSSDLLRSKLLDGAEVFDSETRTTESLEAKMVLPRFRHTSVLLNDGSVLFIGGQISMTVTIIDDRIPEGFPGRERQESRFVTTPLCEFYSPKEAKFIQMTFPESDRPSKLNTPRGRASHATTKLAGPDGDLGTSDDVVIIGAGFQSFSGQFAPDNKFLFNVSRQLAVGLQGMEFFDPITRAFTQVSTVSLDRPKLNNPHIMNLGQFNNVAIDGTRGLGNMAFFTGGNVDEDCPVTALNDLLLVATYTGFGPAGGIQFFRIIEDQRNSHIEGNESIVTNPALNLVARSATNPVAMPRAIRTAPSAGNLSTWLVVTAGVDIKNSLGGCVSNYADPTMLAGSVWDPFFSLPAIDVGQSGRDLRSQRSVNNPLGVIGCWLTLDGAMPSTDRSFYGSTPPSRWARRVGATRNWAKLVPVAGEDGIVYSTDDRVLLTGGGNEYGDAINVGGEPTSPSCEILIMPGSTSKSPVP